MPKAKNSNKQSSDAPQSQARAVIDRIEDEGMAVLLFDGHEEQFDIPLALLPQGATDGDHLNIAFTIDRDARADAEERIRKLQQQLEDQSGTSGQTDFKI